MISIMGIFGSKKKQQSKKEIRDFILKLMLESLDSFDESNGYTIEALYGKRWQGKGDIFTFKMGDYRGHIMFEMYLDLDTRVLLVSACPHVQYVKLMEYVDNQDYFTIKDDPHIYD